MTDTAARRPQEGSDLLDVRPICRRLGIKVARLRSMAERGEFPELLHVDRGEYRVNRVDYEAWFEGRWTQAEKARADLQWERERERMLQRGRA